MAAPLLMQTVEKLDHAVARLQELQCTIQGSAAGTRVPLGPRYMNSYKPRSKPELLRFHELVDKPADQTVGAAICSEEWRRWSSPAPLVHQAISEILAASNFAKQVTDSVDKAEALKKVAPQNSLKKSSLQNSSRNFVPGEVLGKGELTAGISNKQKYGSNVGRMKEESAENKENMRTHKSLVETKQGNRQMTARERRASAVGRQNDKIQADEKGELEKPQRCNAGIIDREAPEPMQRSKLVMPGKGLEGRFGESFSRVRRSYDRRRASEGAKSSPPRRNSDGRQRATGKICKNGLENPSSKTQSGKNCKNGLENPSRRTQSRVLPAAAVRHSQHRRATRTPAGVRSCSSFRSGRVADCGEDEDEEVAAPAAGEMHKSPNKFCAAVPAPAPAARAMLESPNKFCAVQGRSPAPAAGAMAESPNKFCAVQGRARAPAARAMFESPNKFCAVEGRRARASAAGAMAESSNKFCVAAPAAGEMAESPNKYCIDSARAPTRARAMPESPNKICLAAPARAPAAGEIPESPNKYCVAAPAQAPAAGEMPELPNKFCIDDPAADGPMPESPNKICVKVEEIRSVRKLWRSFSPGSKSAKPVVMFPNPAFMPSSNSNSAITVKGGKIVGESSQKSTKQGWLSRRLSLGSDSSSSALIRRLSLLGKPADGSSAKQQPSLITQLPSRNHGSTTAAAESIAATKSVTRHHQHQHCHVPLGPPVACCFNLDTDGMSPLPAPLALPQHQQQLARGGSSPQVTRKSRAAEKSIHYKRSSSCPRQRLRNIDGNSGGRRRSSSSNAGGEQRKLNGRENKNDSSNHLGDFCCKDDGWKKMECARKTAEMEMEMETETETETKKPFPAGCASLRRSWSFGNSSMMSNLGFNKDDRGSSFFKHIKVWTNASIMMKAKNKDS